ncbi:MAG: hypothetical protein ACYCZ2_16585 [Lutibacter sp.]
MKHLKKLSVVLMLTALFSVTFTSCIDNEVSPLVEAIYEAQADLIAAQASVQNAEAALKLAQAQQQEANAAYTAALTASVEIQNANATLENEQKLRVLIAQSDLAVAQAQNSLVTAQAQFDIQMAILMAQLAEAGAVEAAAYAAKYALHVGNVNTLTSTLIGKKATLALKELMLTGGVPNVSWTFYLAGLNADLDGLEGDLAANLAAIDAYQVAMDNPTGVEAQRADLAAQIAALTDANAALAIDIAEAENVRLAADAELTAAGTWVSSVYDPAKLLVTDAEAAKKALVDANVILLGDISDLEEDLANYATDLAAYQLAVSDAQTAYDNAVAAEAIAEGNSDDADALEAAKLAALTQIQTDIALLYTNYQDAIDLLASLEAGEAPLLAAKAAADAALTAAIAAQAIVQAEYDLRKANFEANPAGVTWLDGTDTAPMFETPLVGNHNDALATSYVEVLTWDNNGVDDNTPATWQTVTSATYPADGGGQTYVVYSGAITDAQAVDANYHVFLEVEADDTSDTNANLLNAAVADLDAAMVVTAAAQADVVVAQGDLDTYAADLLAAQEDYVYKKGLYENGVAIEAAAQLAYDNAIAAAVAAQGVETAAEALVTSTDADLLAAQGALTTFELTTEEDIQLDIDTKQATVDANLLLIAEYNILIAKYQDDLDALEAQYDELINTPLYASLQVALLEAEQAKAALEAQVTANNAMTIALQAVIDAIDANYTFDNYANLISGLESANVTLAASIEAKKSAIAIGVITVAGISQDIAALETEIAALEAQIVIQQALADKYKALMDAALAS